MPCLPISLPTITPANDVDEFGCGVVNFNSDVDGEEDKEKKASLSPASRKSNSPGSEGAVSRIL